MPKSNDNTSVTYTTPDPVGIIANRQVGFRFIATIFKCVTELSKSNPVLAGALAEAGEYWAESLSVEMMDGQNAVQESTEGGAELVQIADSYCYDMNAFFDLAEREIAHHNNTDFDSLEFLVKGAKAELFRFSKHVVEQEGGAA